MVYDCRRHPEHAFLVRDVYFNGDHVPNVFYVDAEKGVLLTYGDRPKLDEHGEVVIHALYAFDKAQIHVALNEPVEAV